MSSLFGSKRRRPPNQPLLTTSTAHSDAATAALSAFSRRESSPSLSEAAAAAALKARPHTPTDVSSIVPKRRSVRRSASNSSHGTASPRPPLERAGSAGSMRDRTFRSPSPHGRQSMETTNRATTRPAEYDAPPVPSIPRTVQAPQQQAPQRVGSLRIANTPVRVASQKLKDGGAKGTGTWFGAPSVGDLSNVRASDAALATTNAATAPPKDLYPRPESRSSVNFSYPSRLRLGSPPPPASMAEEYEPQQPESAAQSQARAKRSSMSTSQPTRKTSTRQRPASMSATSDMVYDPNSRRMVPRGELMARERILDDVEPRQSPKKKSSRAGSHLSKGSVSRTQAVEAVQTHPEPVLVSPVATQEYAPPSTSGYIEVQQPTADSDRPRAESEGKERAEQPVQGPTPTNHGRNIASPSNYLPEVVAARQTEPSSPPEGRPSGYVLGKRPSIIHEQVEMEAAECERPPSPHPPTGAIGPARPRQYTYGQPAAALEPRQQTHAPQQSAQQAKAIASPAELSAEAPGETPGNGISEEKPSPQVEARQTNTLRSQRTRSKSPVRVTHFGPVQRTLSVRHSPPPRSISPRKSALKQHSPPRSTSSDDTPESTATSPTHDEAAIARKKSVRVSFSDRETVVEGDEPACAPPHRSEPPDAPSPPSSGRRTWFSNIGRSKKKDMSSLDDDEVMKPRPALPSFGSVREKKKPREEEERPLVRPADPTNLVHSPESPIARPSTASPDGGNRNGLGQSSDRAIGGVLSQDFATRIPANTSRFREPLPPVVTSREGSGYISNTDSSSDSDEELLRDTPALSSQPSAATSAPDVEPESKPLNASAAPSSTVVAGPVMAPTTRGGASSRSQKPMTGTAEPGPVPVPAAALPTIAISEPSPGTDEGPKPEPEKIAAVPGGFPDDEYEHTSAQQTSSMQTLRQTQNETRPASASEVALEPISQALDTERTVHAPATVAATHSAVADDSDSDGTSIYSDAYEDLADMGNDGFQSIDAIVGSGVLAKVSANSPSDGAPVKVPDAEPVVQRPPSPVASPAPEVVARAVPFQPLDDWEAAKAFWRSLTADKRAQLEREAAEEAGIEADLEQDAKAEAAKPRRKKSVEKRQAEKRAIQGSAQGSSERVYTIRPGSKADGDVVASPASPVLRKSMRREEPKEAAPTASPVLRKSMRGNVAAEQQRPSTSYASPDAQSQNPSKLSAAPRRPMSSHATTTQAAAGAAHRAHDRTNSDASSQPQRSGAMSSFFPPMLKRRGSTSSESSFRRSTTRRASAAFGKGESGGFAMRRTLRGAASPEPEQAEPSRRFSMRSFSPADSARRGQMVTSPPVSFNNQQRMRSSLRDGKSKYGKAKGDGGGIHMSSIFRPRSSKGKKSSRFDDSSDDEGGAGGSGFRSRFEDSSDDEATALPAPLPALSAKTMRLGASASRPQTVQEEAESPDLPDSDDDKKPAAPVRRTVSRAASSGSGRPSRQGLGMAQQNSRSGRGAALGTSLMKGGANGGMPAVDSAPASPKARRGSFMSTVLRRKKMGSNEPGKIQRGEVMDSAARRDTTLERSAQELSALRTKRRTVSMPMVPTIQRNHSGDVDEDWPLASPVDGEDEEETVGSSRPSFAKRRSLSQGNAISGLANDDALVLAPDNMDDVAPTTGAGPQKKKKRFPALRRMFRLDD